MSFTRRESDETLLVVLNLGAQIRGYTVPSGYEVRETLASTMPLRDPDGTVRGDEGLILRLGEN